MKLLRLFPLCIGATIALGLASCADKKTDSNDGTVLVKVGKSVLTEKDLVKALPIGINTADSATFASAYIRKWISARLISDIASSEIDMSDIDRLVDEYRNRLIEMEYRKRMADSHAVTDFPDDSLHNYYAANSSEFVLERPMLQGVYLKVPENAPNLALIRRLYRSDKQADIDKLEKEILTSAIHYDYFRDKWVDWEQIELQIPYDFGSHPDAFLRGRDHFETTAGGFVYMLDIKDVLPTGARMPFDNAKVLISDKLNAENRRQYDATLMKNLYDKSLSDGKIQLFVDLQP